MPFSVGFLPELHYRLPSQVSIDLVLQFTRHFSQGVILGPREGTWFAESMTGVIGSAFYLMGLFSVLSMLTYGLKKNRLSASICGLFRGLFAVQC